jgi:hypothetical protein
MTEILVDPPRRPRRIEDQPTPQEWGDVKDVRRIFGLRETFTYSLWRQGKIQGSLIPGSGRARGKRIFSFASIRQFIALHQTEAKPE